MMNKIYFLFLLLSTLSAQAQIYPYIETFDTITGTFPSLNGRAQMKATTNWYVYPRGVAGTNCAQIGETSFGAITDTLTGPIVGPLKSVTKVSFYYRAVKYNAGVIDTYRIKPTDKVDIQVGVGGLFSTQYTINSSTQNMDTHYVKVTIPVPALAVGFAGNFRVVTHNDSHSDWVFHLDSLVVKDSTVAATAIVITDTLTHVKCKGDSTGGIYIALSGGSPPYQVKLNGNNIGTTSTNLSISKLPAGADTITVTDAATGTATTTVTIKQPVKALTIDSVHILNPKCFGNANGSATVSVSGGTTPYTYSWNTSPTQTTATATGLAGGNYAVIATDSNHCTATAPANLIAPAVLKDSVIYSAKNKLRVIVTGGTKPYQYIWTTPIGCFKHITILGDSTTDSITTSGYIVAIDLLITDSNKCKYKPSSAVYFCDGINEISNPLSAHIYPNPVSNVMHIEITDPAQVQSVVTLTDLTGRVVLSQAIHTANTTLQIAHLDAGMYLLHLLAGDKETYREVIVER